jgi:predicted nucleic acid-binding protein
VKSIFVDTAFWVARMDSKDQLFERSGEVAKQLVSIQLVTTDAVLIEVLNFFSAAGSHFRSASANLIEDIIDNPYIEVIYHGRGLLRAATEFYRKRLDKGYSLTDCLSMLIMHDRGISEILTDDKHFRQEGFVTLL